VALHETEMAGTEPVRDEVNKFVGTIVTRRSLWKRLSNDKVIAIVTLLSAIEAALGIGVSLPQTDRARGDQAHRQRLQQRDRLRGTRAGAGK
jgi:hypothetical protein